MARLARLGRWTRLAIQIAAAGPLMLVTGLWQVPWMALALIFGFAASPLPTEWRRITIVVENRHDVPLEVIDILFDGTRNRLFNSQLPAAVGTGSRPVQAFEGDAPGWRFPAAIHYRLSGETEVRSAAGTLDLRPALFCRFRITLHPERDHVTICEPNLDALIGDDD